MRPICRSILFPLLFVFFCEAYPATDNSKEISAEKFARFLDRYEKLKSVNNLDIDMEERKLSKDMKDVWNGRGMNNENLKGSLNNEDDDKIEIQTNIPIPEELIYDYVVDKRGPSKPRYNYYKCYFNPVTCYRK